SIVYSLREHGLKRPRQLAYAFYDSLRERELSFAELDAHVDRVSTALCECAKFQDRALLLFPSGLDFIEAFLGCLRAGVVAIPTYLPRFNKRRDQNLDRVLSILADAQPTLALTTRRIFEQAQAHFDHYPQLGDLRWVLTDALDANDGTRPV